MVDVQLFIIANAMGLDDDLVPHLSTHTKLIPGSQLATIVGFCSTANTALLGSPVKWLIIIVI